AAGACRCDGWPDNTIHTANVLRTTAERRADMRAITTSIDSSLLPSDFFVLTSLVNRKHPHRTPFRDFRVFAREDSVEGRLHAARIAAPARFDCDVLLALECERRGRRNDPRGLLELAPQRSSPL